MERYVRDVKGCSRKGLRLQRATNMDMHDIQRNYLHSVALGAAKEP